MRCTYLKTLLPVVGLLTLSACVSRTPERHDTRTRNLDHAPIHINYADLKVESAAGRQALRARILQAARTVCGPRLAEWYPRVRLTRDTCLESAVNQAISQLPGSLSASLVAASAAATQKP